MSIPDNGFDDYEPMPYVSRCPHGIPYDYGECDVCREIRRAQLEADIHDSWWDYDDPHGYDWSQW